MAVVKPRPGLVPLTFDHGHLLDELAGVFLEATVKLGKVSLPGPCCSPTGASAGR